MNIQSGTFLTNKSFINTGNLICDGKFRNDGDAFFNVGTNAIYGSGNIIQQSGSLHINGSVSFYTYFTFNSGDIIFTNSLSMGRLEWNGGQIINTGRPSAQLYIRKNLQWNGGKLKSKTEIDANAIVNITAGEVILYSTLTNNGTINWNYGYFSFDGGTLINNNNFNAVSNNELYNYSTGKFYNYGSFTKVSSFGVTTSNSNIAFLNFGSMNFETGTFRTNGAFSNAGSLNFTAGATFMNDGDGFFNSGTRLPVTESLYSRVIV